MTFACTCGRSFTLDVFGSSAVLWRSAVGGDPRACPALVKRAIDQQEWEKTGASRLDVLTAIELAEVAGAFAPEPQPNATASLARSAERGAGGVSRPPESASDKPQAAILLTSSPNPGRLCNGDPLPLHPDSARTDEGSPAALSQANPERRRGRRARRPLLDGEQAGSPSAAEGAGLEGESEQADSPSRSAQAELPAKAFAVEVLAQFTDTLEVAWKDVQLSSETLGTLAKAKTKSQEQPSDGPESRLGLAGFSWQVSPNGGRRYQFLLTHEWGELAISKCQTDKIPALKWKLYAEFLCNRGLDVAWAWMEKIVAKLHEPEGASEDASPELQPKTPRPSISREDLAADFLNLPIHEAGLESFVCRPRRKARYTKGDEGWKRLPGTRTEREDLNGAEFWSGLNLTGLTFGKNQLSARIYDKVREIREQSPEKVWLFGHWKRCVACGARAVEHEAVLPPENEPRVKQLVDAGRGGCERTECLAFVVDEAGFMEERDCRDCEGKGKLLATTRCKACRGGKRKRLECEPCQRTGRVAAPRRCLECKGTGKTADKVWRVEIQVRREALKEFCRGVARTCQSCAGLGKNDTYRACKKCKGAGSWACLVCDGSGEKKGGPCRRCEGEGRISCEVCKGEGQRVHSKLCKRCRPAEGGAEDAGLGAVLSKPDPRELVDPRTGLVVGSARLGARNVGEDLELPIDTLDGVKSTRAALWRYVVGGGQGVRPWLAWRTPSANPRIQRTRWKLRDEWKAVQTLPDWSEGPSRDELVRVKRKRTKFKKLLPQLAGLMSSAIALVNDSDDEEVQDFDAACGRLWTEVGVLMSEREEKRAAAGWAAVVREKQEVHGWWGLLGETEMERLREEPAAELALAGSV